MPAQVVTTVLILCAVAGVLAASPTRIVNGTDAAPGDFPFMVSLRRSSSGRHSCGASLLNRVWVMTAAHCVARADPSKVNVQVGITRLEPNATDNVINVSRIFVHEDYTPSNLHVHDIALLRLEHPVTFGDEVQAVRLPEPQRSTPGNTSAILIGWGLNATGGDVQQQLQQVELQTFSDEECSERHGVELNPTTICAGVPEGGKGQCSGDSGGPLLVNGTQVGIVSWSRKPCTIAPYPGVFTEVSAYIDWILKTIGDDGEGDSSDESLEELQTGNLIIVQRRRPLEGAEKRHKLYKMRSESEKHEGRE